MSEENVKRNIKLPYVSFCSDAGSIAAEGMFLENNVHPRAYGSFATMVDIKVLAGGTILILFFSKPDTHDYYSVDYQIDIFTYDFLSFGRIFFDKDKPQITTE